MPPQARCDNCIFFLLQDGEGHGVCRRYPPAPQHFTEDQYGGFPLVLLSSWCGEYKKA